MATKPSRFQQQARDSLAQALVLIAEAARLDGRGRLGSDDLKEIAARIGRASSAFPPEEILARALEQRGRALGLPSTTAEMLTLMGEDIHPTAMLLLTDEAFQQEAQRRVEELGDF